MNKLYILPILLFTFPAAAQSLTPQVITPGGGYLTGSNGSLSFSVGETAVGSFTSGSGSLTQGFQPGTVTANPLPLNFLFFTVSLTGTQTLLEWETTNELNTDHFDIQRSTDGINFTTLFSVPAADPANSSMDNNYQAIDSFPRPGTDYYRLKEVDRDGQIFYSPVVVVKLTAGQTCLIYPNPASDRVFIRIQSDMNRQVSIGLYDTRGQLLLSRQTELSSGINQLDLNIAGLAQGIYIIKVIGLDGIPSFTIMKE